MKKPAHFAFAALFGLSTLSAQEPAQLAIESVNIVDVLAGTLVSDQSVLILDDRIIEVGPSQSITIPDSATVIDGTGLYLTPGLVDSHVHMDIDDMPQFINNGVTTIVEMNGSEEKLRIRSRIQAGELTGPTIYMSSPLLAGTPQNFAYQSIPDAKMADNAVRRSKDLGYNFLKVYDGLSEESYRAIVTTAKELDMPLVGHIPASVDMQTVLDDGFMSIEHVEQIARATVGQSWDQSQIPNIVSQLAAANTAVTPTIAVMEVLGARRTKWFDTLFEREEMQHTPASVSGWWQSFRAPAESRNQLTGTEPGGNRDEILFFRALTLAMSEAGIMMTAGTDTPNPMMVPGYSLHHELQALRRAGLSNAEILAMTTSRAAEYLSASDEFGSIQQGLRADLVLVRSNPLDNIEALQEIEGVVLKGEWIQTDP